MPDPLTIIGTVTTLSALASAGCFTKAARANAQLVRAPNPIGEALASAFDCGDELLPDFAELLERLD